MLDKEKLKALFERARGTRLYPLVVLASATGCGRGITIWFSASPMAPSIHPTVLARACPNTCAKSGCRVSASFLAALPRHQPVEQGRADRGRLISTPTNIGDLYLLDGASGRLERLTHVNGDLFGQLNLTEPEMIWYKSFDGRRVQAWVERPPDFTQGKKYPLILDIHGGPHSAYGYTFDHEFQWMAAKGYVVLYPNPRGSTSYGQEFGNLIQYAYPGDDFKDLMAGVDDLIARGWVDPDKLGVTGGSGGGVLTNWTVGHTTRFKAAVSQRSIADWRDFWYLTYAQSYPEEQPSACPDCVA